MNTIIFPAKYTRICKLRWTKSFSAKLYTTLCIHFQKLYKIKIIWWLKEITENFHFYFWIDNRSKVNLKAKVVNLKKMSQKNVSRIQFAYIWVHSYFSFSTLLKSLMDFRMRQNDNLWWKYFNKYLRKASFWLQEVSRTQYTYSIIFFYCR